MVASNKKEPTAMKVKLGDQSTTKEDESERRLIGTDFTFKHKIIWTNAFAFLFIHLVALRGLYVLITEGATWKLTLLQYFLAEFSGKGITVGAHRLFTHRSFKATPVLRALLLLGQTIAGQNPMIVWCRDHRVHHRYSDTDADPHNSKRGFFFSHVGWLMTKKHPYVNEFGRKVDMRDLEADSMVMFQKKYYFPLVAFFSIFLPIWVSTQYFGETLRKSIYFNAFRYVLILNITWIVNSAAHLYGTRPYDKNLQPVESWFVSFCSGGEGWHNYHHAYPWDYKTSELGMHFNTSATLIRFCEKIGLAYDLKTVPTEVVKNRINKTGDGTHHEFGNEKARKEVKAIGILHPMNPSYTVTYKDPESKLTTQGLPLYHDKDILNEKIKQPEEQVSHEDLEVDTFKCFI